MKHLRWLVLALLFLGVTAGDTGRPEEGEPRNVRLRGWMATDSIQFRLQWNAPARGQFQTPITGYDWELWKGAAPAGLDSILETGATLANNRRADIITPFDCTYPSTFYTARVRATGNFSGPAPWGTSGSFLMECDDSPPGPPIIDLDTIVIDPSPELPLDSIQWEAISLPDSMVASYLDDGRSKYKFLALQDTLGLCAISYRNGFAYRTPWENINNAEVTEADDGTTVVDMTPYEDTESACWRFVSVAEGQVFMIVNAGVNGVSLRGV
jgi:hypothetical protein